MISRRDFIQITGSVGVYSLISRPGWSQTPPSLPPPVHGNLVPADKGLSAEWIQALTDRGESEILSGDELKYIGMPVGGICAGLVYLGGDGQLWLWDIFNKDTMEKRVTYKGKTFANRDGSLYVEPMEPRSPLEQDFSIRCKAASDPTARKLGNAGGWKEITFSGHYPLGIVNYKDPAYPVSVQLEAFSPFIPLNVEDSSLPATVMRYTVSNTSGAPVEVELSGVLENVVLGRENPTHFKRENKNFSGSNYQGAQATSTLEPAPNVGALMKRGDFGTMSLALLMVTKTDSVTTSGPVGNPVMTVSDVQTIAPGASSTWTFVISWCFPNIDPQIEKNQKRSYSNKFKDSSEVISYIAANWDRLYTDTTTWVATWNDSTLPHWFLKRTFSNTCNLATTTSYRFGSGQFWSWEGIYACEGTCTHVWYYAQAMARIFPELERALRIQTDYAFAQNPKTGVINFRGTHGGYATDGQAGIVLRTYREHLMSEDDSFLKSLWPKVKLAMQPMLTHVNDKGLLIDGQPNTLDTAWFGEIAWLSGVYLAALRAAEEMAKIVGDTEFVTMAEPLFKKGTASLVSELFNGEYFYNKIDPAHLLKINSGSGCEIDQMMGQSWAWQVGLGRIFPKPETMTALKSLFRYNFTPDAGHYHEVMKAGRWYAMPGEAGLLICTFPKPDWDFQKAAGKGPAFAIQYFNECQSGYEHEVASHMIGEGMTQEGLTILRAIHDRYAPKKRNPYNEVECGDHYSRAMASYGSFITACGFEYDGPKGFIGFAPRIKPDKFKAAFTAAAGWGSFSQEASDLGHQAVIDLKWGRLQLNRLTLQTLASFRPTSVQAKVGDKPISAQLTMGEDGRAQIHFDQPVLLSKGDSLNVQLLK